MEVFFYINNAYSLTTPINILANNVNFIS